MGTFYTHHRKKKMMLLLEWEIQMDTCTVVLYSRTVLSTVTVPVRAVKKQKTTRPSPHTTQHHQTSRNQKPSGLPTIQSHVACGINQSSSFLPPREKKKSVIAAGTVREELLAT